MPYSDIDMSKKGNDLLPDSTKALIESILDHQSCGIQIRAISREMPMISILDMSLKITNVR